MDGDARAARGGGCGWWWGSKLSWLRAPSLRSIYVGLQCQQFIHPISAGIHPSIPLPEHPLTGTSILAYRQYIESACVELSFASETMTRLNFLAHQR